MIKVCDAIMGSGKTESAINYMREHSDQKFIYVTPYLKEATRIRLSCLQLDIVEPEEKYYYKEDREEDEFWTAFRVAKRTKVMHTAQLVSEGRSIATTHQAFMYYTQEMLQQIRDQHYALIIDEDMEVISMFKGNPEDLDIAIRGGIVKREDNVISLGDTEYQTGVYCGMVRLLKSRNIEIVSTNRAGTTTVFWVMPPDLIAAFDDVFILTYLFKGQALYNMLEMNHMAYEYIGIRRDDTGYHFDPNGTYVPEYVKYLPAKIHIEKSPKLNEVGNDRTALSVGWMKNKSGGRERLQKNIYNYFRNIAPGTTKERLWTTYKNGRKYLSGDGYTKRFLVLNKKASNEYANCNSLVYAANVFMHPCIKMFYHMHGVEINEDMYALSSMVQWVWRSAIRNGGDIWIYIPSKRMRDMLKAWINDVSRLGEVAPGREGVEHVGR